MVNSLSYVKKEKASAKLAWAIKLLNFFKAIEMSNGAGEKDKNI